MPEFNENSLNVHLFQWKQIFPNIPEVHLYNFCYILVLVEFWDFFFMLCVETALLVFVFSVSPLTILTSQYRYAKEPFWAPLKIGRLLYESTIKVA